MSKNIQEQLTNILPNQSTIRDKDYPLLNKYNRAYLDNTATSQRPLSVIDEFYKFSINNIRGSNHSLNATEARHYGQLINQVREDTIEFFNAQKYYLAFTKGTTDSSNSLATRLNFEDGDTYIITNMEHNSEIVSFRNLAKNQNVDVKYIPVDHNGILQAKVLDEYMSKAKGRVFLNIVHVSNFTGQINHIGEIKKKYGDKVIIYADLAQSAGHLPINLKEMNPDFAATSSHKMYGPMGIGLLFIKKGKENLLKREIAGGGAVEFVSANHTILSPYPSVLEAGTQDLEGIIELGMVLKYLKKIGMEKIHEYDKLLSKYFHDSLNDIPGVETFGSRDYKDRTSIVPFAINGDYSNYDIVAKKLDEAGVSVRDGCFCAHIYVASLLGISSTIQDYRATLLNKGRRNSKDKLPGCVRASFAFYNNLEDANTALTAVEDISKRKKL